MLHTSVVLVLISFSFFTVHTKQWQEDLSKYRSTSSPFYLNAFWFSFTN